MKSELRFARRLAFGQALYECGGWFWIGRARTGEFWGDLFAGTASLAVYGLLFTLFAFAFRARLLRWAGVAFLACMPAMYLAIHRSAGLGWGDRIVLVLLGGAAVAAALLPSERWDRVLRRAIPASWGLAALSGAIWLTHPGGLWLGPAPAAAPPAGAPNLVLVSWDTVRADVLDLYGGRGAPTPHLDRLALRSTVFEDAVAHAPITGPSHATMLTGLVPPEHGLRSNGSDRIAESVPTLPERLAAAGYRTAGFVSALPMAGRFGFHRGFERYDARVRDAGVARLALLGLRNFWWLYALAPALPPVSATSVPGAEIQERAAEWLREAGAAEDGRPFFLFVHYYDAHGPFAPAEPWRARPLAVPDRRPAAVDAGSAAAMDAYRGEITLLDDLLGALREELEALDPGLQNTLIAVTADHGECFGEGGIVLNHTPSVLEATQRVPLLLHEPGGAGEGLREPRTVTHADLLPTFLAAAGLERPEGLPGLSLREADRAALPERRAVYVEAMQDHLGAERKLAWRSRGWKFVRWHSGRRELWEFRSGGPEDADRAAAEAERAARLERALDEFLSRLRVRDSGAAALSAREAQDLEDLGYVGE